MMSDAMPGGQVSPAAANRRDADVLRREMGCTREEFLGWLPGATRDAALQIEGDTATLSVGGGTVAISFRQLRPRMIGLISIPVLEVTFRFGAMDAVSRAEFLAYFDLYTKRGGG